MTRASQQDLLEQYASLPEPYQPVWGVEATRDLARRACDDRLAAILPLVEALPVGVPLRILDIGCAQGYFSLALRHLLIERGRDAEIIGVDYLIDNVDFCQAIADYHGSDVKFIHDQFDGDFFQRYDLGHFDVILALNVLHHIRALNGDAAADEALKAIQSRSRVLICEIAQAKEALAWVGTSWHSSDDDLLRDYTFKRKVAEFSTHLTDVDRPLYVCSQSLVWLDGRWYPFYKSLERSHSGVPDDFAGQRKFFFSDEFIVKRYRCNGEYGQFNREELRAEEGVLNALRSESGRYPLVIASEDTGEHLWMVREALPGRSLLDVMQDGSAFDADEVAIGLLQELVCLEKHGFHHGDIRCWNILINKHDVRLIDFGSMTVNPSPLHRVALASVLLEMAQRKIGEVRPFYSNLQPLDAYPAHWRSLVRFLITMPEAQFSYAEALRLFRAPGPAEMVSEQWLAFYPSSDVLGAVSAEAGRTFLRLTQHAANVSRELGKVIGDANTERVAVKKNLTDAQAYADSFSRELASTQARAEISERHAQSLATELSDARRSVEELSRELDKVTRDAVNEREAATKALQEAPLYAESLLHELESVRERAEIAERYSVSLEDALEEARRYTDTLSMEIDKVRGGGSTEHERMRHELAEAHSYAQSLLDQCKFIQERAETLERHNISSTAELDETRKKFEAEIKQLLGEIDHREVQLCVLKEKMEVATVAMNRSEKTLAALRRRFQLFKLFWPRDTKD